MTAPVSGGSDHAGRGYTAICAPDARARKPSFANAYSYPGKEDDTRTGLIRSPE